MGDLPDFNYILALKDLGAAELFVTALQESQGALGIANMFDGMPSLAHIQPQMLLSLAWPRYLQELAASKTPITQVGPPLIGAAVGMPDEPTQAPRYGRGTSKRACDRVLLQIHPPCLGHHAKGSLMLATRPAMAGCWH